MNYMSLPQSVTISFVHSGNQTDHIVQAFTFQVKEKQNTICMQQILMYQCVQVCPCSFKERTSTKFSRCLSLFNCHFWWRSFGKTVQPLEYNSSNYISVFLGSGWFLGIMTGKVRERNKTLHLR